MTQGLPTVPQLDLTEPLWYERTQDMSGYVLPEIISPPLDEQFNFTFNAAQNENDFYVQNSGNPSPEEFLLGDQTEAILGDDSNMFDNSNYSMLHTKIKAWLPNISTMEIDEFAKTSMIDKSEDFLPRFDSENSLIFSETPKVDKKPLATNVKKPRYLSIFDSEEPHIKEEQDLLSSCSDSKSNFDLGMEVAEEVVVTTEQYESKSKINLGSFPFESTSLEFPIEPNEEVITTSEPDEGLSSPLRRCSKMETSCELDMDFADEEDLMYALGSPSSPLPSPKVCPQLHLDIEAAIVSSSQLLCGTLPDTPEVLKPVLKPGAGFDLVNFLLANGDSNNNAVIAANPSPRPCMKRLQDQRQGKSCLSLSDLKECQKYGRGKPSPRRLDEESDPTPAHSTPSTSGRPTRKSATKFKKLLEEGLLDSTLDSHSISSDDEDSPPRSKRRRTISSSSSRKRLNSDSDRSSIGGGGNVLKYRERRDRNNLSSKRSRQKRKVQQELKKMELKELETKNKKLKKKEAQLEAMLDKVHMAWKEYLVKLKKENR